MKVILVILFCFGLFIICYGDQLNEANKLWDIQMSNSELIKMMSCHDYLKKIPDDMKLKYQGCRNTHPLKSGSDLQDVQETCVRACMWKKIGLIDRNGTLNGTRAENIAQQMYEKGSVGYTKLETALKKLNKKDSVKTRMKLLGDDKYNTTMTYECVKVKNFLIMLTSYLRDQCF